MPAFDRDVEISRAGARLIPANVDIVTVEGNYLLLRRSPWKVLRPLFDLTVMLEGPGATSAATYTAAGQVNTIACANGVATTYGCSASRGWLNTMRTTGRCRSPPPAAR